MATYGESFDRFGESEDSQLYGMPFEASSTVSEETMTPYVEGYSLSPDQYVLMLEQAADMEDWETVNQLKALEPEA